MRSVIGGRAAVGVGLGVVLLLAGLAGCSAAGGSGAAATTTTSGQQAAAAVLGEFVRCARANGMPNLPDLRLDSNGQVSVPPVLRSRRSAARAAPARSVSCTARPAG
jgi:hypothetical protein